MLFSRRQNLNFMPLTMPWEGDIIWMWFVPQDLCVGSLVPIYKRWGTLKEGQWDIIRPLGSCPAGSWHSSYGTLVDAESALIQEQASPLSVSVVFCVTMWPLLLTHTLTMTWHRPEASPQMLNKGPTQPLDFPSPKLETKWASVVSKVLSLRYFVKEI